MLQPFLRRFTPHGSAEPIPPRSMTHTSGESQPRPSPCKDALSRRQRGSPPSLILSNLFPHPSSLPPPLSPPVDALRHLRERHEARHLPGAAVPVHAVLEEVPPPQVHGGIRLTEERVHKVVRCLLNGDRGPEEPPAPLLDLQRRHAVEAVVPASDAKHVGKRQHVVVRAELADELVGGVLEPGAGGAAPGDLSLVERHVELLLVALLEGVASLLSLTWGG